MINQLLHTPWNFMRWLRLFLGFSLFMQFAQTHDAFSLIVATFFLYQVYTNTGCCGTSECSTPLPKTNSTPTDIQFIEIESKENKK